MDDIERMLIERACTNLSVAYAHRCDIGDGATVADLFTEDGTVEMFGRATTGRDKIRQVYGGGDGANRTRHVCSTIAIDVVSADEATGVTYLTMYTGAEQEGPAKLKGPLAVGEYRDTFRRTDDGWRIAQRRCEIAFSVGR